ncbi:MAG: hypothetical protein JWR61_2904 [Ferruginibacter sp.]|uniref:nucleotidyltransferase domain-containing protein n=1 Tax=Ferruginibacter sp. TaxID=1940288 RepID=UPI00265A794F|nr:nucleotidyltransferase [Ferruginibacter sp.]MDB5277949.1 hypothetical protein [Ferruginibacter sp.]
MLTNEKKIHFTELLDELGENLDISETQFDAAVASYKAVGNWLCANDSLLKPYNPTIKPQGSMIIGTAVQPVHKTDDLDIDLVCELSGKAPLWTQKDLKDIVGNQLEAHKKYESILDKEGRRCWTLKYREGSPNGDQYHMDILPAIIRNGYQLVFEKAFSDTLSDNTENLSLSITDNKLPNYKTEKNSENWLKSNPFGYAKWFMERATIGTVKLFSLNEAVKPVPKYQKNKFPLQRVVQILKRHRDIKFKGDPEKPISIIITTLAGYAYRKEANLMDALTNVIENMHLYIQDKVDHMGRKYKFIGNPVNPEENFADKWLETPAKQQKFFNWLAAVKHDLLYSTSQPDMPKVVESLAKSFGEETTKGAYLNMGKKRQILTEQSKTRFDTKLGIVAGASNIINPHKFYGTEE